MTTLKTSNNRSNGHPKDFADPEETDSTDDKIADSKEAEDHGE